MSIKFCTVNVEFCLRKRDADSALLNDFSPVYVHYRVSTRYSVVQGVVFLGYSNEKTLNGLKIESLNEILFLSTAELRVRER